ncbi:MAG: aminoglycoside phosphotransferase, partial [Pseudonocardiales bacterium]|nr:aminoglycoside phosphotransferase [Pseudonocardiales bacterium]
GQAVRSVSVAASTPLLTECEPLLDHLVLAVALESDASVQHYQLLMGRRRVLPDVLEHAAIGIVDGLFAYDGLGDYDVTAWLLAALRDGRQIGDLRFVPEPGVDLARGVPGRLLGIEQSNTSVTYGEKSIFKLFRRLLPGVNPDLELHRALRSVGSREVAGLQGAVEGVLDGEPATLGMLLDFAANSAEGWAMAQASVRDLFAEADLRADEVGGDFAAEACRLGETVAVVHDELARALGTAQAHPAEMAASMSARLTSAAAEVPALAEYVGAIQACYDTLAALDATIATQRVHGDLHLGQTLRTIHGWLLIDFEGEPATPLELRVRPDSVLRDVAAMLRSFDYAAFHQLATSDKGDDSERDRDTQLVWRAKEWAARNRGAFCDGYAARTAADPREQPAVLRAFELDKAVYEVRYETRSRPAWVQIPLGSIARLLVEGDAAC